MLGVFINGLNDTLRQSDNFIRNNILTPISTAVGIPPVVLEVILYGSSAGYISAKIGEGLIKASALLRRRLLEAPLGIPNQNVVINNMLAPVIFNQYFNLRGLVHGPIPRDWLAPVPGHRRP